MSTWASCICMSVSPCGNLASRKPSSPPRTSACTPRHALQSVDTGGGQCGNRAADDVAALLGVPGVSLYMEAGEAAEAVTQEHSARHQALMAVISTLV